MGFHTTVFRSEIGTRCRPGWMQKMLFIQNRVKSQVIINTKYKTVGKRVVNQHVIRTNNPNFRINRQGLVRIRIGKQRGVL